MTRNEKHKLAVLGDLAELLRGKTVVEVDASSMDGTLESVLQLMQEVHAPNGVAESPFDFMYQRVVVLRGMGAKKPFCHWDFQKFMELAEEEFNSHPHRTYRAFKAIAALTSGLETGNFSSDLLKFLNAVDKSLVRLVAIHSDTTYCPIQMHKNDQGKEPPLARELGQDLKELINGWAAYLAMLPQSESGKLDHHEFFLNRGQSQTELHYDSFNNVYFCGHGVREWVIGHPLLTAFLTDEARKHVSAWNPLTNSTKSPLASSKDSTSKLDFLAKAPQLFTTVLLQPGDALFVPSGFWHLVKSIPDEKSNLSFAFNCFWDDLKCQEKMVNYFDLVEKAVLDSSTKKLTEPFVPISARYHESLRSEPRHCSNNSAPSEIPASATAASSTAFPIPTYKSIRKKKTEKPLVSNPRGLRKLRNPIRGFPLIGKN